MSDLIRRQDAIDACRSVADNIYSPTDQQIGAEYCLDLIKEIPSADCDIKTCPYRTERKKGEWIDEKINSYTSRTYCSECGSSAPFVYESDDYYGNHAHGETAKTKFCPNCGADMRL